MEGGPKGWCPCALLGLAQTFQSVGNIDTFSDNLPPPSSPSSDQTWPLFFKVEACSRGEINPILQVGLTRLCRDHLSLPTSRSEHSTSYASFCWSLTEHCNNTALLKAELPRIQAHNDRSHIQPKSLYFTGTPI